MNNEGYKDPTFDEAYGNIKRKERLCKKYNVQIGATVKITVEVSTNILETAKKRIRKVRIVDVNEKFVTYRLPAGYCESMFWEDFQKARCDVK